MSTPENERDDPMEAAVQRAANRPVSPEERQRKANPADLGKDGLPNPPKREEFGSDEEHEEAMGFWHARVGRIRAMVARSLASKASKPR